MKEDNKPIIELPKVRSANQRYVMFLMESPSYDIFPYDELKNYFNWTMTYKRSSDFFRPYGWIAPKDWKWHLKSVRRNFTNDPLQNSFWFTNKHFFAQKIFKHRKKWVL